MPGVLLARNISTRSGRFNVIAVPAPIVGGGLAGLASLGQDDGIDWSSIIDSATAGAAKIITATRAPSYPGYGYPGAQGYGYLPVSAGITGGISSNTILLIALGLGAVMMLRK